MTYSPHPALLRRGEHPALWPRDVGRATYTIFFRVFLARCPSSDFRREPSRSTSQSGPSASTIHRLGAASGYARGQLVRSIPLTPNETLDIVTKIWDKRTERRQVVEAIENDVSSEYVGDEKWSLATRKELTATLNGSVNGNATQHSDISLPLEVVDVSAGSSVGIGGDLGGSLSGTIGETTEHITQETIKAANRLKTTVTSTVEIVSEIGNEVTRTQKISNPNRCHSISYHFFEITERHSVRTKAVSAAPYLLVPLDHPVITYEWVLCHECELKALLPCEVYYQGFAAAKLLRAREQLGQFLGSLDSPAINEAATSLVTLLADIVETTTRFRTPA